MSQIEIGVSNGILTIWNHRERKNEADLEEIRVEDIQRNQVYNSYVNITKDADINQIFYFEPYEVSEDQTERNNTNIQTEDDVEDETDEME